MTLAQANPGYSPQISMPFMSSDFAASGKVGGAINGVYINGNVGVTYSSQSLKQANQWVSTPAYGYLNLQDANQTENSILDFNREKDGIVRDEGTNLWMPRLTYDSYSVTGHGMFGSFRPYRRDIGMVWDQTILSESSGSTFALEGAAGSPRIGITDGGTFGFSITKRMELFDSYNFNKNFQSNEGNNQMVYFKAHGEPTTKSKDVWQHLGKYEPLRLRKNTSDKKNYVFDNQLEGRSGLTVDPLQGDGNLVLKEKEIRNSVVLPILNQDLLKQNEDQTVSEVLREFHIQYFDHTNGNVNDFSQPQHYDRREVSAGTLADHAEIASDLATEAWVNNQHKINKPHHAAGFSKY